MRHGVASKRDLLALLGLGAWSLACVGQETMALQKFTPSPLTAGVIRNWGDDAMGGVMAAWQQAFRKYHSEITFESTLRGSGTGMAGVITGVSDLSLMGRPATSNEIMGFEWVSRYKPTQIQVLTGSLKEEGRTPALVVFVSQSNPLNEISVAQLAGILGCPEECDRPATWGSAGAQGAWADKTVHAYLYDSETGTGAFLQQAVLGTADRWNWSVVKEFKDAVRADGTSVAAGQQSVEALKQDPNGLAVSTLGHSIPGVKALALAGDGRAVNATAQTLIDGSYPLTRGVYLYVNRKPGQPLDAKVKEFLRFILSEEGQDIARRQGDYLPLNAKVDQEQLKKIE